jgi:hypothetical protein
MAKKTFKEDYVKNQSVGRSRQHELYIVDEKEDPLFARG